MRERGRERREGVWEGEGGRGEEGEGEREGHKKWL